MKKIKGYWYKDPVYHGDNVSGFIDPNWRCSNCNHQAPIDLYWGIYDLTDICPYCYSEMIYNNEVQ